MPGVRQALLRRAGFCGAVRVAGYHPVLRGFLRAHWDLVVGFVARFRAFVQSLPLGSRARGSLHPIRSPRGSCSFARAMTAGAGSALPTSRRTAWFTASPCPTTPSNGPCHSRVATAGETGASAVSWRSAARTSSGRTAGVICRTTIRSVADSPLESVATCGSTSRLTTAALASSSLLPLLVSRSTMTEGAARKTPTAERAALAVTPGRSTSHCEASSPGLADLASTSTTSITSIPSGRAASSSRPRWAGSRRQVSEISKYSASLADPVGAPPEYEILGCGENPAEYATGTPALRTPRSIARATSLWLANRILPLLAYLIVRR
jgi:hypothetical protein